MTDYTDSEDSMLYGQETVDALKRRIRELECAANAEFVLFLQWLKQRLKESMDAELRNDILLKINANFREEMMKAKRVV